MILGFAPIFIYYAIGLSGLVAFSRVVLGWAMSD